MTVPTSRIRAAAGRGENPRNWGFRGVSGGFPDPPTRKPPETPGNPRKPPGNPEIRGLGGSRPPGNVDFRVENPDFGGLDPPKPRISGFPGGFRGFPGGFRGFPGGFPGGVENPPKSGFSGGFPGVPGGFPGGFGGFGVGGCVTL